MYSEGNLCVSSTTSTNNPTVTGWDRTRTSTIKGRRLTAYASGSQPQVATQIRVAGGFTYSREKVLRRTRYSGGGGESKCVSQFKQNDGENVIIKCVYKF